MVSLVMADGETCGCSGVNLFASIAREEIDQRKKEKEERKEERKFEKKWKEEVSYSQAQSAILFHFSKNTSEAVR